MEVGLKLLVLFQENMETASSTAENLASFMCPVFQHIGLLRNDNSCSELSAIYHMMGSSYESGTPLKFNSASNLLDQNVAAAATSSSSPSSSTTSSFNVLPAPLIDRLCKEVFTMANTRLKSVLEARGELKPPVSWMCTE